MPARHAHGAGAANGIDLVDEDDTGGVFPRLLEHVTHAAGTDTDEHLDEVGPGDGEERHVGLTGNGLGEQGLTRTRRAHHQHALGDLSAQTLEFLWVSQEIDDFFDVGLGFLNPRHVGEGGPVHVLGQQLGLGPAEAHPAAATALHLPHHEEPETHQQQDRQQIGEELPKGKTAGRGILVSRASVIELGEEQFHPAGWDFSREPATGGGGAGGGRALDHNLAHLALIDQFFELRNGNLRGTAGQAVAEQPL